MATPPDRSDGLPARFFRATLTHARAATLGSSQADQDLLKKALADLQACERLVSSMSLFSSNEDKDDIATADLKYLQIPSMQADLMATMAGRSSDPQATLENAENLFGRFLSSLRQYALLPSSMPSSEDAAESARLDAGSRRAQKIARFKQERAMQARMESLRSSSRPSPDDEEEAGDQEEGEHDRELAFLELQLAALHAAAQQALLAQELQLLAHKAEAEQEGSTGEQDRRQSAGSRQVQSNGAAPLDQQLREQLQMAAAALQNPRAAARDGVFRPSHQLPTISIEQQGLIELKILQQQEAAAAAAKRRQASQVYEGSDEEDADLERQRAWDDWKDEHPSGYGNSKLRPTA